MYGKKMAVKKKAQNTTVLLKNSGGLDCAGYYETNMFRVPLFERVNNLITHQR